MKNYMITLLCILAFNMVSFAQKNTTADICVYGGTSSGVIAAYTAAKSGKTVILIEPGKHVGGLSSGGLGYTDIGNKYAVTGLANNFYRRIGQHYGKFEQWIFEPHVAEGIFNDYLKAVKIEVLYSHRIIKAVKNRNGYIQNIVVENAEKPNSATNKTIAATVFIDCSYEGDLMAKAGVPYTVGRESNAQYGEHINGVQVPEFPANHQWTNQLPDGIDPYKIAGNPASGLLWGISTNTLQPQGSGDKAVQAYNYRICLTDDSTNLIPITKPEGYDASKYELLLRVMEKKPWTNLKLDMNWSLMPNRKTDINNKGGFSTDMIGANYRYPDASYQERKDFNKALALHNKGLLYFLGNDPEVPAFVRAEVKRWGYPKDEYTDNDHWSPQPYIREARRMIGEYVMTENNCLGKERVADGVGTGAYGMDSHNCQRLVVLDANGKAQVKNEGDVQQHGFSPYPIAYRAIVPPKTACKNLLVPVCLSASHIAYGSIRMEPVFMVLGQSSAVAATLAINTKKPVQEIDVKELQRILAVNPLADGSTPEILIDNENAAKVSITGDWKLKQLGGFGPSMLYFEGKSEDVKKVKFTPTIKEKGNYAVYIYSSKMEHESSVKHFNVFDGKQSREIFIKSADIIASGQTTGGWVALGTYDLPAGDNSFVEITNKNADGIVIADAVLFVPIRNSTAKK
ncbi:FAD dependent oxidoreductase [Chitinophaga niastensis]|uniref:FAD dependent oxidoreductase n=1 Tax=Chitinophaga niastensis TaxID=536980 RepID=A0A2P8HCG0_CHINA|nr:FAD-dependent oxidoreductase [Chitinophaga niastensis]PSL43915.1 FAD dependent oxidoreductase [Chitinophaga niastensis]